MREVWKIRLKPDGTWENVYRDEFYQLDPQGLVDWHASKFYDPKTYSEIIAKEVIECLMKK